MTTNASSSMMSQWLHQATKLLEANGVGTARLDCLVLLEVVTGKDRTHLLAHPSEELNNEQLSKLNKWLELRSKHIPLAYIRSKTEFYGREFVVDKRVLEPRPESETMINLLKTLPDLRVGPCAIVDVGCGSGALGITAALEIPGTTVTLVDIDSDCLVVARNNAKKHGVIATFLQGDLLQPVLTLSPQPTVLLCNLPYVPDDHTINKASMHEPKLAIFGGPDGLDLYRRLFHEIAKKWQSKLWVLTESLPFQHDDLRKIAENSGLKQLAEDDFIQVFSL
jgi:release factor glutamine methyltransferase